MIRQRDIFNRAAETYDFGAVWKIEDLAREEVAASYEEYKAASSTFNELKAQATFGGKTNWTDSALALAQIRKYEKYVEYLKKEYLYFEFLK